jgi:molybdate transport system substrate-binding protein
MLTRLAAIFAVAVSLHGQPPPTILVSAAVSLTEALEEIGSAYAQQGGGALRFNFAGSNVLARQIGRGAPADVFISADEAQMDLVETAGGCLTGSRANIVSNRLALVAALRRYDLEDVQGLTQAAVRRVAIGDPAAVPAGVYARQYLQRIGLWSALQTKIVPSTNVRAALTAVENGSADAGFVYVTDVAAGGRARIVSIVSGPDAPSILYPACVVAKTRNKDEAIKFLSFLRGPIALRTFERRGFLAPPR